MDLLTHYFQIILLGIVEGVTEFLPISSTGHLLIAEALGLGQEPDVFNVVIQAGAILAVVFIYWHKIVSLLTHLENPAARAYLLKIFVAFAVTSAISLVLIKHFKLHLPETLVPVAWATLIGGFVIFAVEILAKNLYAHDDVSWTEAILMGAAQVVAAVFPGASRSGSTIMTGLALGMKRPAATEFSFLLGIPTMFAASALDIVRYRKQLTTADHQLVIDIALGFFVSMVVAFFVVKWLLHFVISHTFNGFAIYRVILGVTLLIALGTHALPDAGASELQTPPVLDTRNALIHEPGSTHLDTVTPTTPMEDKALLTSPTNIPAATPTTNDMASPATNADMTVTNAAPVAPAPAAMTNADSATNSAPANAPAP